MLSAQSRPYIDASVPVLRKHGLAITTVFYKNLFESHPQLHHIFNAGNQANGTQQQSLASAVFAYAANIGNQAALAPVISRIVHKHVSLGVTAAHYPIVGQHLLDAIKQVLGDAATPELIAAWAEAYGLLAQALIDEENKLYKAAGTEPGDLFALRVVAVNNESTQIKSFTLVPADGAPPSFHPGQYISVAVTLPNGLRQLRQYSLSDAPNRRHLRISVKHEIAGKETPAGTVSNWLHDNVKVGSVIYASKPFGDFKPDTESDAPIVLLSAGVGITPMISALNRIADVAPQRRVIFAHAARHADHHPHRDDLALAQAAMPNLRSVTFYEEGGTNAKHFSGRMQLDKLPSWDIESTNVYMCGPLPFMKEQWANLLARGVPVQHLHREVFGPDLLDHLI
ncbi:MAG TPA: globin domain-containing protein [Herminiimonas sp.]|jgi:nitric oxide dioxygenase|nr:globin domain-containing protein [Herminiimonas sp.]